MDKIQISHSKWLKARKWLSLAFCREKWALRLPAVSRCCRPRCHRASPAVIYAASEVAQSKRNAAVQVVQLGVGPTTSCG